MTRQPGGLGGGSVEPGNEGQRRIDLASSLASSGPPAHAARPPTHSAPSPLRGRGGRRPTPCASRLVRALGPQTVVEVEHFEPQASVAADARAASTRDLDQQPQKRDRVAATAHEDDDDTGRRCRRRRRRAPLGLAVRRQRRRGTVAGRAPMLLTPLDLWNPNLEERADRLGIAPRATHAAPLRVEQVGRRARHERVRGRVERRPRRRRRTTGFDDPIRRRRRKRHRRRGRRRRSCGGRSAVTVTRVVLAALNGDEALGARSRRPRRASAAAASGVGTRRRKKRPRGYEARERPSRVALRANAQR